MAKPAQHYKVIIAEGGIAGVTLTLIFEKLGISYFLLESRDTLESNRGASIGLTSARVASIEESDDYVTVTTIDGLSLTADIVVGADGVRSTVRIQIDSNIPEALTADDLLPAPQSMACQRPPKASPRVSALPFTERTKQSSASQNVPFSQVPRYTEAEAEALCQSVAYIQVTPKLKFGGIYKNRVVAVKTGVEEGVAKGWHTDRAIIVGDAACKALSAGGQGASQVIELCAVFVNSFMKARKACYPGEKLSSEAVKSILPAIIALERFQMVGKAPLCTLGSVITFVKDMLKLSNEDWILRVFMALSAALYLEDVELTARGYFYNKAVKEAQAEMARCQKVAKEVKETEEKESKKAVSIQESNQRNKFASLRNPVQVATRAVEVGS
ncbi:hypothetical protein ACHAPF_009914 [Botrytis cinerea]